MNSQYLWYKLTSIYAVGMFTDMLENKANKESNGAYKISIQTTGIHPVHAATTIKYSQSAHYKHNKSIQKIDTTTFVNCFY